MAPAEGRVASVAFRPPIEVPPDAPETPTREVGEVRGPQPREVDAESGTMRPVVRNAAAATSVLVVTVAVVYLALRIATSLHLAPWPVIGLTAGLVFGESFFLLHMFGFAANVVRGTRHKPLLGLRLADADLPRVAVFVTSYNEPVPLLRETLLAATAMDYPRKRVCLLDDSTDPKTVEALRAMCDDLGVTFFHRGSRRGYKAGALNDALKVTDEPLIAIFDADQRPGREFLRANVPRLIADERTAYLQLPQIYTNIGESLVAFGAEVQQTSFHDFVCVGKDAANALFYLGTNVILRRTAVEDAGGFVEHSVTEDIATSYRMHKRGWHSLYRAELGVRGVGPANLLAYYNQQYRWAYGNLRLFPEYARPDRKISLRPIQRWEYFLSMAWWFQGWAHLALLLIPPTLFLFGLTVLGLDLWAYLAAMVPFLLLSSLLNALALRSRGYSARGVLLAQSLSLTSFPVYIKAVLDALRGRRVPFRVTAKESGLVYVPFRTLAPQIAMIVLTVAGLGVGLWQIIQEPVLTFLLGIVLILSVMAAWEGIARARELQPLRMGQQRAAWRAFQLQVAAVLVAGVAFLLGLSLLDVAARTPAIFEFFTAQWSLALGRAWSKPVILFNLFWAAYNYLFLHGIFLFRVGTQ